MDNYTHLALIGAGSFGRVYKALDKQTSATVALKIIAKRGRTTKEIHNLRGECQIQRHLRHPNIIRMLHSFETPDEIVVVTEYAQSDLHKLLIREGCISEERARPLTHDLVSALHYLHSHRILHRDLKPQNILLDANERAKLCDFGLARNMTMGTHVLTSIKGTPLYMAPELMSEKPYDQQADLWSLGCIVYETMAGEPPFCDKSFIRLVKLIRHQNVRWPTFLSDDCISFLKGLLEKDPIERLSWTAILQHPFVHGHVHVGDMQPLCGGGGPTVAPLTHPLSQSQCLAKEKQLHNLTNLVARFRPDAAAAAAAAAGAWPRAGRAGGGLGACAEMNSSQDSVHAILQSDIECLETDGEEAMCVVDGRRPGAATAAAAVPAAAMAMVPAGFDFSNLCFVSGNANLIVNNFNDNFVGLPALPPEMLPITVQQQQQLVPAVITKSSSSRSHANRDLEKRKLSQNLENFSVRQSTADAQQLPNRASKRDATAESSQSVATTPTTPPAGSTAPPPLRPGWDSCDEYQHPPIENDEWLAFLYRSMQEVLDGEWDALRQQNLVSIIVAPLRNGRASVRVVECVAQLLSLPLVLPAAPKDVAAIRGVYLEVKLVPNLVYASKLLCTAKASGDQAGELAKPPGNKLLPLEKKKAVNYKLGHQLNDAERRALLALYELITHLVHLNDQHLMQFYDAVAILGVGDMLAGLLTPAVGDPDAVRLAGAVLGVLCFALRELPENAELIVQIVLHERVGGQLAAVLGEARNERLRQRWCRMLRMLGRFSCHALQAVWTAEVRAVLERWLAAEGAGEAVRHETKQVLDELIFLK